MAWAKPRYSKKEVDAAGEKIIDTNSELVDLVRALEIVNNWRSSHYFPLNTIQIGLRDKTNKIQRTPLIAQRIKRLPAIIDKLKNMPHLTLSKMQDIGGCRAVVNSVGSIKKLVELYDESWHKHKLIKRNDYLTNPKESGYRGYHLVYAFESDKHYFYNTLRIEIQIRSQYQHYWATAVETVGTSTHQALKSGFGKSEWRRFFALMGTIIAEKEKSTPVPGTPTDDTELILELRELANQLDIIRRLQAYIVVPHFATEVIDENIKYRLMVLDVAKKRVKISDYSKRDSARAFKEYAEVEKEINGKPDIYAVLASTDDFRQLKKAYPNYFGDTSRFVKIVKEALNKR